MSSGGNFPPRGHPWRTRCSTGKPRRPSLLSTQRRDLILNGGDIRFPVPPPIKWSSVGAATFYTCSSSSADVASDANYRSSVSSKLDPAVLNGGAIRFPIPPPIKWSSVGAATFYTCSPPADVASEVDGLDANNRSSASSRSDSVDIASVVDSLDANYGSSVSSKLDPAVLASVVDALDANYRSSAVADSQLKYDVFISFRGPDSRDDFVSHLYDDLRREGIETFIDSEKLEAGEEIEPALSDAIEGSRISVVVFTKEYASSKWCMREVAQIMECRRSRGQLVLPVFLGVEPKEVRWETGSYAVAFSRHDKAPQGSLLAEEVKRWRKAMKEAASLSGFDSSAVRPASKLVDKIVARILENLESKSLFEDEGLVGAYPLVKEVERLLENGSDEVQTIGICGMGGSGKTAIAGVVFNRQHQKFDSCCFLANVRQEFEKHDLIGLRNRLLGQILGQPDINISTPDIGSGNTRNRLRRKKVLIVLDDVWSITQLEFLMKQPTYFGPGSRIIITTRDMDIIKNVDDKFSMMGLSDSDSLKLFSSCAFKQSYPPEEYFQLSMRAADYAKGLPLALKVLGSFLCKKSVLEWESALRRCVSSLDEEIFNVLRVSYDRLNDEEKTTFLNLACLFNGGKRSDIAALLDSCGISADIGIRALVDKSMITLSNDRIQMHDLLQKMGREIVKQESPRDPSKRSRLWNFEEVHGMFLADGNSTMN
ncbi:unnamed protein product [Microthlaspi erraticum]|uniref:ADP-ribosyl cyclase/cyclic ADP-ribose hydrolase n=1 Tax=Microthlaspi erraticum TaxID=1685480 RepID=A0A6D2IYW7_9BRAS|nr:unnamed protein product [Microthlaspi erraticum]